jgi:hypothetical protein
VGQDAEPRYRVGDDFRAQPAISLRVTGAFARLVVCRGRETGDWRLEEEEEEEEAEGRMGGPLSLIGGRATDQTRRGRGTQCGGDKAASGVEHTPGEKSELGLGCWGWARSQNGVPNRSAVLCLCLVEDVVDRTDVSRHSARVGHDQNPRP